MLDFEKIKKFLPQKFPFIMVDRVLEFKKNKVIAIKNVTANEIFFLGHFPEQAIMPGAMIIEGMAQTSIIGWYYINKARGIKSNKKPKFYFGSVKARFYLPVVPGDTMRYEVSLVRSTRMGIFIEARAYVSDKMVSEAELICSVKK